MPSSTSRLSLPYPLGSDAPNVPSDIENLANALDSIVIKWTYGTLSVRPAAGHAGTVYVATDQVGADGNDGLWCYDNGTSWIEINPPGADILASSVTNSAEGDSAVVGTSTMVARQDHVHGREGWPGSGGNYGTATTPARSDHAHSVPLSELTQSGASSGQVVEWNGSAWVPGAGASGAPGTTVEDYITAGISVTSSAFAIASVTLVAGTWLIHARVVGSAGTGSNTLDVWIGPNSASPSGAYAGSMSSVDENTSLIYNAVIIKSVTLGSTTTVYLNGYSGQNGGEVWASTAEEGIGNITGITAMRTA